MVKTKFNTLGRKAGKILGKFGLLRRKSGYRKQKNVEDLVTASSKEKDSYKFYKYSKVSYENGDCFRGQLKKKIRHGFGVYTFASGDRYEGSYNNSKKEGHGNYYFSNGDKYEGEFKKNRRHGFGRYVKKSGKALQGRWDMDFLETNLTDDQFSHNRGVKFRNLIELDEIMKAIIFEELEEYENQVDPFGSEPKKENI